MASLVRAILCSDRLHGHRQPLTSLAEGMADTDSSAEGQWPRIITPRESDLIRALLALPERRTTNSSQSLLGGLALCGVCGKTLVVGYDGKRLRRYVCRKNNTRQGCGNGIAADRLDAHIAALILQLPATKYSADKAKLLWPAVAEVTADRKDNIMRFARGLTDLETFQLLRGLQQEESARLSQAAIHSTRPPGCGWDDLGLPERRRAIQREMRIVVNPARRNGRFDAERVVVTRLSDPCV